MKNQKTHILTHSAIIASLYASITLILPIFSFGTIQFRLSEALTVLPLFSPYAIYGLSLGCFVANLLGFFMGQTPIFDILFGTMATFCASIITFFVGKIKLKIIKCILAPLAPIFFNSIILSVELTLFYGGVWWLNLLSIGVSEFISCYLCGEILIFMFFKYKINL